MGVIHAYAYCEVCGKEWTSRNAQALAAKHFYATGHCVTGEIAFGFSYPTKNNRPRTEGNP